MEILSLLLLCTYLISPFTPEDDANPDRNYCASSNYENQNIITASSAQKIFSHPLTGAHVKLNNRVEATDTNLNILKDVHQPIFYKDVPYKYRVLVYQSIDKNGKYGRGNLFIYVHDKSSTRATPLRDYDDARDKGYGELYLFEYKRLFNWIRNQNFEKLVMDKAACISFQPPIYAFGYEVRPDRCPWPREEEK